MTQPPEDITGPEDRGKDNLSEIARLDQFYHSQTGRVVSYFLRKDLQPLLRLDAKIDRIGFGYPFMCLPSNALPVLIPNEMGALAYGPTDSIMTAAIHSDAWPLASDSINQIIMCHGLEFCHDGTACLAEANRVLASSGELVLLVPNRRSLWVRDETTPLGQGRPFSKGQVTKLLTSAGFEITRVSRTLFLPPFAMRAHMRLARALDHIGHFGWGVFGGMIIVHATKLRYAKNPVGHGAVRVSLSGALRPAVRPVTQIQP